MKDGRIATLDFLKEEDLPEIVEALNSVIRESAYLALDEEIVDMNLERKWYKDRTKAGMSYLVARVAGEVVGGASIEPKIGKFAHTAVFGIFIKDGFRNIGMGTRLTNTMIEIARQRGFEMPELSVFGSNERARHVYNKCGFEEVGKIKKGVKMLNGTYIDMIILVLPLR